MSDSDDYLREKQEARDGAKAQLQHSALTEAEIERFLGYEFDKGPETIPAQIDRYALMLKRDHGKTGDLGLLTSIERSGVNPKNDFPTKMELARLTAAVSEHIGGCLIRTKSDLCMSGKEARNILAERQGKTLTEEDRRPEGLMFAWKRPLQKQDIVTDDHGLPPNATVTKSARGGYSIEIPYDRKKGLVHIHAKDIARSLQQEFGEGGITASSNMVSIISPNTALTELLENHIQAKNATVTR